MKLIISSLLIILAFFTGYFFAEEKNQEVIQQMEQKKSLVEIKQTKKKLSISKSENTEVYFNGEKIEGEVEIEID